MSDAEKKGMITSTAAYAAVLVVFVGESTTTTVTYSWKSGGLRWVSGCGY
jgi:hypothetical protein